MKQKIVRILSINVAQLPYPLGIKNRNKRATKLVEKVLDMGTMPDVIIMQELFSKKARKIVKDGLNEKYPHCVLDNSRGKFLIGVNSGLAIFSKYIISKDVLYTYKTFKGVEDFAKKGVMGARIEHPEKSIYLFTTHLQTGTSNSPFVIKIFDKILNVTKLSGSQIKLVQVEKTTDVISTFVDNLEDDTIFFGGDFNIVAGSQLYNDSVNVLNTIDLIDSFSEKKSKYNSTVIGEEDRRIDYIYDNLALGEGSGYNVIIHHFGAKGVVTDHYAILGKYNI